MARKLHVQQFEADTRALINAFYRLIFNPSPERSCTMNADTFIPRNARPKRLGLARYLVKEMQHTAAKKTLQFYYYY